MAENKISRRTMLRRTGWAVLGGAWAGRVSCMASTGKEGAAGGEGFLKREGKQRASEGVSSRRPFRISLNVSTIRGYELPVQQQIDACAEAGFDGIELWTRDVDAFTARGGSHEELRRQLQGNGLWLENMIGFSAWAADDPAKRADGLKQMRHDMEMAAGLGSRFIAAPVQGMAAFDAAALTERYRTIVELGDKLGVTPMLELWGTGIVNRLADALAIAVATGHPKATVLLDFYHLYRGGNALEGLHLVNGKSLPVFHINDYPAQPPRTELKDSDRVFPGDGICPFQKWLPLLYDMGFRGGLSVELFNKGYWETLTVKEVLKKSLEKTRAVIDRAMAPT